MVKRILVGVDFSEASHRAMVQGTALARQFRAPLALLHLLEPPALNYVMDEMPLPDPRWAASVEDEARKALEAWGAEVADELPDPIEVLVRWGRPIEGLVTEADEDTLLVVGQVGHAALQHLLFGSTASGVARHAPCDVLIVPGSAEPHAQGGGAQL